VAVETGASGDVSEVNFGINKRPEAEDKYVYLDKSPNLNTSDDLWHDPYVDMSITDEEDGSKIAEFNTLRITSVDGMNGNLLRYRGELITGDSVIHNFKADNLKVVFVGVGSTSCYFNNTMSDSAGFEDLTPAVYVIEWGDPLPVEWLSFAGEQFGENIILYWSTAAEWNAEKFLVEHRLCDGSFQTVGEVEAVGFSNVVNEYSFEHVTPEIGVNYYRITQLDFDGASTNTNMIPVEFESEQNLKAYPVPFADALTLNASRFKHCGLMEMIITDQYGRIVRDEKVFPHPTLETIELDMTDRIPGMYFIQIKTRYRTESIKVVKS